MRGTMNRYVQAPYLSPGFGDFVDSENTHRGRIDRVNDMVLWSGVDD